ncbi:hypothetical protein Ccrd_013001, partial [Cynara cardunculus var. scolymus]
GSTKNTSSIHYKYPFVLQLLFTIHAIHSLSFTPSLDLAFVTHRMAGGRSYTASILVLSLVLLIAFADVAQIAKENVHTVALQHRTRSRACSSVKSVAPNACACQRVFMATNRRVLAITIGRLKKANPSNAKEDVKFDARRHRTRSRACSSAKSVAPNACAYHRVFMVTNRNAVVATITGRPRKANPSALNSCLN